MLPSPSAVRKNHQGFTLIEMAIVLLVMGLLLGSGITLLGAKIEQQKIKDTQKILEDAKEALLGYAIANGRLPCPATSATSGQESPIGGGACTNPYDGFFPAATLGLPGQDANGFLTDAWQTPANRIRYAVSRVNGNAATTSDGIRATTMSNFSPDLRICASSTGITATTCGSATALSNNAVAVIFSLGKNAVTGGTGNDEAANLDGNPVFVSHTPAARSSANGEFDDMVTWLPSTILFNRMLQAGRLP